MNEEIAIYQIRNLAPPYNCILVKASNKADDVKSGEYYNLTKGRWAYSTGGEIVAKWAIKSKQ